MEWGVFVENWLENTICQKRVRENEWEKDKLRRPERRIPLWHSHAEKQFGEALDFAVSENHCPNTETHSERSEVLCS